MKLLNLTLVRTFDWDAVYDQYGKLIQEADQIDWVGILSKNVCRVGKCYYYQGWIDNYPEKFSGLDKELLKDVSR
jgi:hypothetical protein